MSLFVLLAVCSEFMWNLFSNFFFTKIYHINAVLLMETLDWGIRLGKLYTLLTTLHIFELVHKVHQWLLHKECHCSTIKAVTPP